MCIRSTGLLITRNSTIEWKDSFVHMELSVCVLGQFYYRMEGPILDVDERARRLTGAILL